MSLPPTTPGIPNTPRNFASYDGLLELQCGRCGCTDEYPVGRIFPCPCGSGKKFKKCCLKAN